MNYLNSKSNLKKAESKRVKQKVTKKNKKRENLNKIY